MSNPESIIHSIHEADFLKAFSKMKKKSDETSKGKVEVERFQIGYLHQIPHVREVQFSAVLLLVVDNVKGADRTLEKAFRHDETIFRREGWKVERDEKSKSKNPKRISSVFKVISPDSHGWNKNTCKAFINGRMKYAN